MFTGGHCKGAIEKEVSKLDGVTNVLADPASKDVVVEFDVPATWDLIKETLIKHEFPPQEEKVLEKSGGGGAPAAADHPPPR